MLSRCLDDATVLFLLLSLSLLQPLVLLMMLMCLVRLNLAVGRDSPIQGESEVSPGGPRFLLNRQSRLSHGTF